VEPSAAHHAPVTPLGHITPVTVVDPALTDPLVADTPPVPITFANVAVPLPVTFPVTQSTENTEAADAGFPIRSKIFPVFVLVAVQSDFKASEALIVVGTKTPGTGKEIKEEVKVAVATGAWIAFPPVRSALLVKAPHTGTQSACQFVLLLGST
jgi:hypothetical protein